MDGTVLALVLVAAVTHAGWNFAAKRANGDLGVVVAGMLVGAALYGPIALMVGIPGTSLRGLALAVLSGVVHVAYFSLLAHSYRTGDISVVYPIGRGSGVVLTAILAAAALGERLPTMGYAGVGIVAFGAAALGLTSFRKLADGVPVAIGVGASIAAYSVIDKFATPFVHPLVHVVAIVGVAGAILAAYLSARDPGMLQRAFAKRATETVIIGIGSVGTYVLILLAYRLTDVSYVVAAREFSVVIGAALGFMLLKERVTFRRIIGVAAMTAGLVLLKLS